MGFGMANYAPERIRSHVGKLPPSSRFDGSARMRLHPRGNINATIYY
jgi:hypothetical protein